MEKTSKIVLTLGDYTEIIEINFPTRVNTGEDISWYFTTHLKNTPPAEWTNLALSLQYVDGPQDKITADSIELSKGEGALGKGDIPSTCTNTKLSGKIKALTSEGTYTFRLLAGHYEADTFYGDSVITIYLTATKPPSAPTTPAGLEELTTMLTETFMPMMMQIFMLMMIMSLMTGLIRGFKPSV